MIEFAVDGHDGAGKTPVVEGARESLGLCGLRVATASPFHLANALVPGGEIYPLWATEDGARTAMGLLERVLRETRQRAREDGADVLIFDRHWMTVLVEVRGRGCEPCWTDFVPTFFVRAPPEKTMACDRFSHEIPWTASVSQVRDYHERYLRVAAAFPERIAGSFDVEQKHTPLGPIVWAIVASVQSWPI